MIQLQNIIINLKVNQIQSKLQNVPKRLALFATLFSKSIQCSKKNKSPTLSLGLKRIPLFHPKISTLTTKIK